MLKQNTVALNQLALAERLREQDLKQYWVARQIGVTPLTVNRWLTGKVRRISLDNLERLAELLKCTQESLILHNELQSQATQAEQSQAARLLVSRETQALFVAQSQFSSYESLLRAVMHPNLPLRDLLATYSSLTMAAAEQGRFEQARSYGQARLELAARAGDLSNELEARLNLLTIDGADGQILRARKGIEDLVQDARWLPDFRGFGMALMNLYYIYYLQGELDPAVRMLRRALAQCALQYWLQIRDSLFLQGCLMALEIGELELAERCRQLSLNVRQLTLSRDQRLVLNMLGHLIASLRGHPPDMPAIDQLLADFAAAETHDELSLHIPAAVLRQAGRLEEAGDYLRQVSRRKQGRAYDAPFLQAESARLAQARGHAVRAAKMAAKSRQSCLELCLDARAKADPLKDLGGIKISAAGRRLLFELVAQEEDLLARTGPGPAG